MESSESRIALERHLALQGSARVDLCQIDIGPEWQLNEGRIKNLTHVFKKGVDPLRLEHHVEVIVSRTELDQALREQGLATADLRRREPPDYPVLRFLEKPLRCLHGKHRVHVARKLLPPRRRWWIVDLYIEDTSDELKSYLAESYCHETRLSTGEIYLHLREAQINNDKLSEKRWRARLTPCETERLEMLKANPALYNAFDALIDLPAIVASGAILTVWNKLISLRCKEELIYYLENIYRFWAWLVGNNRTRPSVETRRKMRMIDTRTIKKLEGFAPGASQADQTYVKGVVLGGDVFRNFSEDQRSTIGRKLVSYAGRIPSLRLFFEDTKFLAIAARRVKRLTDNSPGRLTRADGEVPSIKERMDFMFHAPSDGVISIQTSENESRSARSGDGAFEIAYRQIWLCALRSSGGSPGEGKRPAVLREWAHPHVQYCLARLASGLGFSSDRIEKIVSRPLQPENPPWDDFEDGKEPSLKRHGIPYVATFKYDRKVLFLDRVHANPRESEELTSSFVLRDIYHSFFGDLDERVLHAQRPSEADSPDIDVDMADAPPLTRDNTPEPEGSPHTSRDGQRADSFPEPTTEPPSTSSADSRDEHGIGGGSCDTPGSPVEPTSTFRARTSPANGRHEEDDNDEIPNTPTPRHREHNNNPPTTPTAQSARQSTSVPEPIPPGRSAEHGPASEWIAKLEEAKKRLQDVGADVANNVRHLEEEEKDTSAMWKAIQEIVPPEPSDNLRWDADMQKDLESRGGYLREKVDARVQRLSHVRSTFHAASHEVEGQLENIESFLKNHPTSTPEPERIGQILVDAERGRVAASDLRQKGLSELDTLRSEGLSLWDTIGRTQIFLPIMCIGGLLNGSRSLPGKVKDLHRFDSFLSSDFGSFDGEAVEMHQKRQRSLLEISQGLEECLGRMAEIEKFRQTDYVINTFGAGREGVLASIRWLTNLKNEAQSQVHGYWKSAVDIQGEVKRGYSNVGKALREALLAESRSWGVLSSKHINVRNVFSSLLKKAEDNDDVLHKYLDDEAKNAFGQLGDRISKRDEDQKRITTTLQDFKSAEKKISQEISILEGSEDKQILISIGKKWVEMKRYLDSKAAERQKEEEALDAERVHGETMLYTTACTVSVKAREASKHVEFEKDPKDMKGPQEEFKSATTAMTISADCAGLARSLEQLAETAGVSDDVHKKIDAVAREAEEAAGKAQAAVKRKIEEYIGHNRSKIEAKAVQLTDLEGNYRSSSPKRQQNKGNDVIGMVKGLATSIFRRSTWIESLEVAEDIHPLLDSSTNAIRELQVCVTGATETAYRIYGLIATCFAAAIQEKGTWIAGKERSAASAVHAGNMEDLESCTGEAEQGAKDMDAFIRLLDGLHTIAEAQRNNIPGYVFATADANTAEEIVRGIDAYILSARGNREKAKLTVGRMRRLRIVTTEPEPKGNEADTNGESQQPGKDHPAGPTDGDRRSSTERVGISQQELITRAHELLSQVQARKSAYMEARKSGTFSGVQATVDAITSLETEAGAVGRTLADERAVAMGSGQEALDKALDACFQVAVDSIDVLGMVLQDTYQDSEDACKKLDDQRALNQAAAKAEEKETWRKCVEYGRVVAVTLGGAIDTATEARSAVERILEHQTGRPDLGKRAGRSLGEMDRWLSESKGNLKKANEVVEEMELAWWREKADRKASKANESFEEADRAFRILTEDSSPPNKYELAKMAHTIAVDAYREAAERRQDIGEESKESYTMIIEKFGVARRKALAAKRSAEAVLEAQSKGNKRKVDEQPTRRSARRSVKQVKILKIRRGEWQLEDHEIAPGMKLGVINVDQFETLVVLGEGMFFLEEPDSRHGLSMPLLRRRARHYSYYERKIDHLFANVRGKRRKDFHPEPEETEPEETEPEEI